MIRRAALLGLAVIALTAACRPARSPVRDVLLITLDTTRADRLGCYGYGGAATPQLDALASAATLFDQAVAPAPMTLPSHATIFTGLEPYNHGVRYNGIHRLPSSATTLAEQLQDAGFRTGAVPSSFAVAGRFGLWQGFEDYQDLFEDPEHRRKGFDIERNAGETVDLALRWWERQAGEPRLLWVHIWDPHWEYEPPFPFSAQFADRPYDGEIAYTDRELGRLFDELKAAGDWETTLIVVAGDHGEGLYQHGERFHSTLVYESTQRVPLIIRVPGAAPRRVAEPVGLSDIAPTILDYLGIASDVRQDGISLRSAIENGSLERRAIYFEAMGTNIHYGWNELVGVRLGPLKYFEGARAELYDLASDPDELVNRAGMLGEVEAELGDALEAHRELGTTSALASDAQVLDPDALAELVALGYVGGPSSGATEGAGVHPPDMVHLEQELMRAQAAIAQQAWDEAREALDFVLGENPTNRYAMYFRTKLFLRERDLGSALTLAEAMTRIYVDAAEAQDLLGEVLTALGRFDDAVRTYAAALERHPQDLRLRYHHVLALLASERMQEAEAEIEHLERDYAQRYTGPLARSMLEARRGRAALAVAAIERALELGLEGLDAFDASEMFVEVRNSPEYAALKDRIEQDQQKPQ